MDKLTLISDEEINQLSDLCTLGKPCPFGIADTPYNCGNDEQCALCAYRQVAQAQLDHNQQEHKEELRKIKDFMEDGSYVDRFRGRTFKSKQDSAWQSFWEKQGVK